MDERQKVSDVLSLYQTMRDDRDPWEQDWKTIAQYMFPKRSLFHDTKGRYERVGGKIYDGTAISALNILANGLVGYMVSAGTQWFKLGTPDPELSEFGPVRRWLDNLEMVLYQMFHRSNFYEEITESFMDVGAFGTGMSFVGLNNKKKLPYYKSIHPKEMFIQDNYEGRVDTAIRRFFPTLREIAKEFGRDVLDETLLQVLEKQPYTRMEVLHMVTPREERDRSKLDTKNMPFESMYVLPEKMIILRESGFTSFPYPVVRWSVNSDETYGRGPGNDATAEVLKANQISRTLLKAGHMAVDPPLNVPEAMRNRLEWRPGGKNYYNHYESIVRPVELGQNFPIGVEREAKTRQIIEQYFMVDFFMMLQNAPQGMTATEVIERQTEKSAVLTPVIGRIGSEFLDPMISLTVEAAMKFGFVEPPPPEIGKVDGQIEVEYRGPLAQAQRRFHRTHGVRQSLAVLQPMMEMNPEIADLIDWDGLARQNLIEEGMPAKHIKDQHDVNHERKQRQQQQQQMMQEQHQAEVGEKQAKALKDASQAGQGGVGEQLRNSLSGGQA